jgi:hypothetical protein
VLPIFAASAVWVVALLGLGHLVARWVAPNAGPGTKGLLGLLVLTTVGTALHLFVALSPPIAAGALLLGLAAFATGARQILRGVSTPLACGLAGLLAILSLLSDFPARHYDMGLYWLQSVKWTTEFAQVPGLATLHARLGFNSSWFTVSAMLEHPLAAGKSGFLVTTTLLFFGGWIAIDGALEAVRGRRDFANLLAGSSGLLVIACAGQLGGHSPDAAGAIIGFAALLSWARALEGAEKFRLHAAAAVILSALAFTIKLLLHRGWLDRRTIVSIFASVGALLVPWIAHGYLASGCPLFPSKLGCAPVSWATPASIADDVNGWIRSWARAPGRHYNEVLGSWDWLDPWSSATLRMESVQVLLCILGMSLLALVFLSRVARPSRTALLLWSASLAGALFWFAMAPAPRFGWAYLFGAALVPAAEAATLLLRRWPGRASAITLTAAITLAAFWIQFKPLYWLRLAPSNAYSFSTWPPIPKVATYEKMTLAGSRVRLPLAGDQCWGAPLPCTPYFDPGLVVEGSIRTTNDLPIHP